MAVTTTDIQLGVGTVVGVGLETTYDTAVTPTYYMQVISAKAVEERPQAARPHLHAGTGRVAQGFYAESHDVTVSLEVELGYDAVGLLLRSAMGPAPSTTGGPTYAHPFLLGNVLPSLTFRIYVGTKTGGLTGRYHEVSGAKCNSMRLSCRAGETPRLVLEYFGRTITRGAQATPTIIAPTPVLYHQISTFSWNSGTYDGNSLELLIDNGLARRRNLQSLLTAQPHPSSLREVSLTIQRDHADEDFVGAMSTEIESDFVATWTGTSPTALELTLHSARVMNPVDIGASAGGFGAIGETIELAPRNVPGGTDYGLKLLLTNENASYIT